MREYRDYFGPEASRPFSLGLTPAVRGLIIANVAVFFASLVAVKLLLPLVFRADAGFSYGRLLEYVGLVPRKALLDFHIWQFFTYSFFHDLASPLHLLFNMVTLYFFGREVETIYGTRRLLFVYFAAAFFAGLCHCIDFDGGPLHGASGAVYAVLILYALHFPRQKILFFFILPLDAWIVVAILIGFDVTMWLSPGPGDNVSHLAHLGGALFGFLFFRFQGRVESYMERVEEKIAQRETAALEELEARVDEILAKINREGMSALSKKELEILRRASKHYQRKV
jgi:membrane associated rhomboid family serine protease